MFDELTQIILDMSIESHYVFVCGGMNAHTQERDDFVLQDDKFNLDKNSGEKMSTVRQLEMFNIPLKRKSTDVHRDFGNYGSALLRCVQKSWTLHIKWQMW